MNKIDKLNELIELLKSGAIDQNEFESLKKEIIHSGNDNDTDTVKDIVKDEQIKQNISNVSAQQNQKYATDEPITLKWYQKPTVVVLFLIFFFPVGLFLMWKHEVWIKPARWIITGIISFAVIANYNSNNSRVSACDCANLYEGSSRNYSYEQLNNGNFLRQEAHKYVEKAKNCAIKYGNLTEFEAKLTRDLTEMNMIPNLYQAVENARKECALQTEFNKKDSEIACDCWNQSVERSGMAFDNMNRTQQQFRQKCFEVFMHEAAMQVACEKASKK